MSQSNSESSGANLLVSLLIGGLLLALVAGTVFLFLPGSPSPAHGASPGAALEAHPESPANEDH